MIELRQLAQRSGQYQGHGITGEEQPFYGELTIVLLFEHALSLHFRATGIDGTLYIEERGLIAQDEPGKLSLWALTAADPLCVRYSLRFGATSSGAEATSVFGRGGSADPDEASDELAIDLLPEGDIIYRRTRSAPGDRAILVARAKMSLATTPVEVEPQ